MLNEKHDSCKNYGCCVQRSRRFEERDPAASCRMGQIRFGPVPTCKVPGASLQAATERCEKGPHISTFCQKLVPYCAQLECSTCERHIALYQAEQRNARVGCSRRESHDANSTRLPVVPMYQQRSSDSRPQKPISW